jgi:hypothetical protein
MLRQTTSLWMNFGKHPQVVSALLNDLHMKKSITQASSGRNFE